MTECDVGHYPDSIEDWCLSASCSRWLWLELLITRVCQKPCPTMPTIHVQRTMFRSVTWPPGRVKGILLDVRPQEHLTDISLISNSPVFVWKCYISITQVISVELLCPTSSHMLILGCVPAWTKKLQMITNAVKCTLLKSDIFCLRRYTRLDTALITSQAALEC